MIGTGNAGKLREYAVLLDYLPLKLSNVRDVGLGGLDIEEPYSTYAENAIHKARIYANASRLPTLADDSGLEVDALGGRPGVYSARYAPGSDRDRYTKLLSELQGTPDARRGARFMCVIALVFPDDTRPPITTVGTVEGRIAHEPAEGGAVGFGYDFVFIPNGYDAPLSTLGMDAKNLLSHRGNAIRAMLPHVEALVREEQ